ncbi:O-antigen ligase family protein [Pseudoalteromonas rhizosphaerae]|uniref:O-antigen ligase family protein n=1 Tax=Pseudoalteromonas rhizosphaerae TaxID=2518973 RepID=UPI00384D78A8
MKIQKLTTITLLIAFFSLSLLPFIPLLSYDYHNHQRILQIALLLGLSFIFAINLYIQKNVIYLEKENINITVLLLIFIFIGITSSIFSDEIIFSLFYTFHIFLLVIALSLISSLNDKSSALILIYALVIAHTGLFLVCLLNIIFTLFEQQPLNPYIIYSGFINIRFFNQVQVFVLPFLILLLKFKDIQRVVFFVLFLNLLLIFIGQARGALLSFLVISLLALILKSALKKQIFTGLICLTLSLIAFYSLNSLNPGGADITRTSTSGRIDLWLTTLNNFTFKHIFIGNGPGIFEMSLGSSAPFSHPHNSIVETLNEWGGIALICLSTAVYLTIKKAAYHIKRYQKDIITESLFYSFLIGITYSFCSGVHVMPVSQTLLFIIWGLLLARVRKRDKVTVSINNYWKIIITIILIIGWCFYLNKAIHIYNSIDPDKGYIYGPRFWSVGQRI